MNAPQTFLALLGLLPGLVLAHGDEVHGEAPPLPANSHSLPSAEAHSLDFELVAQLQGDTLTVYLDRYSDNQPVSEASIEVASAAFSATLAAVAPGTYQASAAPLNHPGQHELLFTVLAGEQSDLLDARLSVSPAPAAEPLAGKLSSGWLGAAVALLAVLLCGWLAWRRQPQGVRA